MTVISCSEKMELPEPQSTGSEGPVKVSVSFEEGMTLTKSSYSASEKGISNLCLFVFNSSGTKLFGQYYTSTSGISLSLPAGTYTFKAVANMGNITSSIASLSSYNSYTYSFTNASLSSAFPMSGGGSQTVSATSTSVTISLERLVAKFALKVSKTGIKKGTLTVKSVTLKNIAGVVKPSASWGVTAANQLLTNGDSSSSSDVSSLNSGNSVTFYVPENMQGTESSITASKDKTPQHNYSSVRSGLCTYLEVACSYFNGADEIDDVTYRMYLGANATSSFDIARNTSYSITLSPDSDHIYDGTWKCENDILAQIVLINNASGSAISPSSATVAENCFIAVKDASGNLLPVSACTSSNSNFTASISSKTVGGRSANCAILVMKQAGTATYHIKTTGGLEFDYSVTANKPTLTISAPTSYLYLDGATISATASWKKADGTSINPGTFFNTTAASAAFVSSGITLSMSNAYKWTSMSSSMSTVLNSSNRETFQNCVGAKFASTSSLGSIQLYVKGFSSGSLKTMLDGFQSGGYFCLAGTCSLSSSNFISSSSFTVKLPWTNKSSTKLSDIHDYSLIPSDHLKSGLSHTGSISGLLPAAMSNADIPVSVTLERAPYAAYASSVTYKVPARGTALSYSFSGANHPAGRHRIVGRISNSVSGESIDINLGYLECYTHIPIGTRMIISSIGAGGSYYDDSARETLYPVDMYLYATFPWQKSSSQDYPVYYLYTKMKSSAAYKAMIQGTSSSSSFLYQTSKGTGLENQSLQWIKEYEVDWQEAAISPPTLTLSGTYVVNGKTYSGDIGRISNYDTTSYANDDPTPVGFYYTELYAYMYSLYDYTGTTTVGTAGNSARYAHMGNASYKDDSAKGYYILEHMNASTKYHDLNEYEYSPK